jgi:predicted RNase H-like HicB family nuclease
MPDKPAMTASVYLSIPYRIEAFTYEAAPGRWLRRASYPELPDCVAEAPTITAALDLLERRRVEVILTLIAEGKSPPVPRPPLRDADPEGVLRRLGLDYHLPLLDRAVA